MTAPVVDRDQLGVEDQADEDARQCAVCYQNGKTIVRCQVPAAFLVLGHCANQHTKAFPVCLGHLRLVTDSPGWACRECRNPWIVDSAIPL